MRGKYCSDGEGRYRRWKWECSNRKAMLTRAETPVISTGYLINDNSITEWIDEKAPLLTRKGNNLQSLAYYTVQ